MKSAYCAARSIARHAGLGRLRDLTRDRIHQSGAWLAVPPRRLKDIDRRREFPPHATALTFDDGPDPHVTPRLLQLLESYSARATFFMCGLAAKRHPELVRAVIGAGHSVGGHSWDHTIRMLAGMPISEWRRQIDDTQSLLADLTGAAVPLFRPPRGIIDRRTLERLRMIGLTTVLWSIDGRDCTLREPEAIARQVTDKLAAGEITLLHDSNASFLYTDAYPPLGEAGNQESTLDATKRILEEARLLQLKLVPLEGVAGREVLRRGRPRFLSKR